MSAGNFTLLNIAKKKIGDGTFDLDSHAFKLALTTDVQSLTAAFSGTSTNAQYSDLTNEMTGTGYSAGGVTLGSVTWTRASGTVTFDAADVVITGLTGTFKYGVIYDNTSSNKDILAYIDFDTTPGSITVSGTTLTITFDAAGIFHAS